MGDIKDKIRDKANDAENKIHEMKGRAQQKLDGDDENSSTG